MVKMTQPILYSRGSKLWVRFSLNGEVIKKSLHIKDSKANKKIALNQLIPQVILSVHSGEFFKNQTVPTVKEMIHLSLEINKNNRKVITQKDYISKLNKHVVPHFGNRKIDSLKASELALWQNKLLKTLSSKSVVTTRVIFHGVLEDALRDEIIPKNPFSIVKSPKNIVSRENKPFSKEEIFKILKASPSKIRAFFAIGFFTGMRTGEITALKWSDVDLENRSIKVSRTRNRGIETTPKTKSSIREIDIIDVLFSYLIEHQKFKTSNEYLFLSKLNKPYHTASKISYTYWEKILEGLNIQYRNLYQMRHTFASMMISSGEDILWVSNMLGHKNSNITLSVYAKYMKSDKKSRGSFLLD